MDEDLETGLGGEIGLSYRAVPAVTLFFDIGVAAMEGAAQGYTLTMADLGVRLNVRPSARFNPYVQAAFTGQAANFEAVGGGPFASRGDLRYSGYGATLGVGLQYTVASSVSVVAGLDGTVGAFLRRAQGTEGQDLDGFDTQLGRLGVGVSVGV